MTVLRGYMLEGEFRPTGGGMCEWTFCRRGSDELFIKRFLRPKYPVDGAPGSPAVKSKMKERCAKFEDRQRALLSRMQSIAKGTGNIVIPTDFFREDSFYYKVTPKIDRIYFDVEEIARLSGDDIIIIMLTALNSLNVLHNLDIVHGDLKPDNILIKRTAKSFAAKLIDFDDSFRFGEPPPPDLIVGDQVYFSPEVEKYIRVEDPSMGRGLSGKVDVFALGIIFHQYWTGRVPEFPRTMFRSLAAAANGNAPVRVDGRRMPSSISELIARMLDRAAERRPSVLEIVRTVQAARGGSAFPAPPPTVAPGGPPLALREAGAAAPALRGKGLSSSSKPVARADTAIAARPDATRPLAGDSGGPTSSLRGKMLAKFRGGR